MEPQPPASVQPPPIVGPPPMVSAQPLYYAPPPAEAPGARHNRIYTVLLLVFAFFLLIAIMEMLFFALNATEPGGGFIFYLIGAIYGMFFVAIVVTLILRATASSAARTATMALNIILLIILPFGTALGIYGLMKVDKSGR